MFDKLDDTDLALLKQTGLRGTLERMGSSGSNSTTWPRAKAMIVFTSAIAQDMSLPQPKHCSIASCRIMVASDAYPQPRRRLNDKYGSNAG